MSLGKGGTPISFLIAGIITLITCYSYVKLSLAYPNRGGTVKIINQGFELIANAAPDLNNPKKIYQEHTTIQWFLYSSYM